MSKKNKMTASCSVDIKQDLSSKVQNLVINGKEGESWIAEKFEFNKLLWALTLTKRAQGITLVPSRDVSSLL